MKLSVSVLLPLTFFVLKLECVQAAKILAIVAAPSYSHQVAYRPIWQLLGERGHEVTVVTTNPVGDPKSMSYKEINMFKLYDVMVDNFMELRYNSTWIDLMYTRMWDVAFASVDMILGNEQMQKLYDPNSGEKFDVVLAECLIAPSLYALAYRFNAPLIGLSSLPVFNFNYYLHGAPILPSHPSSWEMESRTGINLPFWKRVRNFYTVWSYTYWTLNDFMVKHQRMAEKYLGKEVPDLRELEANMSLVLMYQRDIISYVRPSMPKIIPIGGIHLTKDPAPLPKEVEDFVSNAREGFIYVSLGTNANTNSFSDREWQIFYDVLSNLPCKVLWKFADHIPNKSANIYAAKWFPQESVLSHPKIRAFVYQGGLQSTEEALAHAVPLVGLPILADQDTQVSKMVSLGVARQLEITSFTAEDLDEAIRDVLTNKRYKEKMIQLSDLSKDQPYNLLNHAVWWIEFVIRHKGAPHLQCSIAQEPWYQRYDMDIIAFLSVSIFLVAVTILAAAYKCLVGLRRLYKSPAIKEKEKVR